MSENLWGLSTPDMPDMSMIFLKHEAYNNISVSSNELGNGTVNFFFSSHFSINVRWYFALNIWMYYLAVDHSRTTLNSIEIVFKSWTRQQYLFCQECTTDAPFCPILNSNDQFLLIRIKCNSNKMWIKFVHTATIFPDIFVLVLLAYLG